MEEDPVEGGQWIIRDRLQDLLGRRRARYPFYTSLYMRFCKAWSHKVEDSMISVVGMRIHKVQPAQPGKKYVHIYCAM